MNTSDKDRQSRSGVTGNTNSFAHLKTSKGGVSLHPAIRRMADIRMDEEGYRSRSAYVSGLIAFDYFCRRKHLLTAKLMREPIETREKVFAELLQNPGKTSSWFEHRIEEIIQDRQLNERTKT